ncbi:DUF6268 family outer membrane beta-barrel protein [Cerina litoralis]|nr:DUF6268 family outer membrane beta-barrel protein [Cerina litoralis]
MPRNSSSAQTARLKLVANFPIRLKKEQIIFLGAEYNGYKYSILRDVPFEEHRLASFQLFDFNMGYSFMWNKDWRFIGVVTPRLMSTFSEGIRNRDFKVNATAALFKERKDLDKPYRLVLGLTYNTNNNLKFPLPLVYYEKRFHPNWSFTVGIPKNDLKYYLTEKHILLSELLLDGYFVNVQGNIALPNNYVATDISSMALVSLVGYQYKFTKLISVYGYVGTTLYQNGDLRDESGNEVYTLNDKQSLYLRTGFKIGIF